MKMMEHERFGDPMAKIMDKEEKKEKEGKFKLKVKCKFAGLPNRFGISPGHRWDGVDRSNGYEAKFLQNMNLRKDKAETANIWSMREL